MDHEIEIIPVQCYIVRAKSTGNKTAIMKVVSKWNGMLELRATHGDEMLVVAETKPHLGLTKIFNELIGADEPMGMPAIVIMGSPELLSKLYAPAAPGEKP